MWIRRSPPTRGLCARRGVSCWSRWWEARAGRATASWGRTRRRPGVSTAPGPPGGRATADGSRSTPTTPSPTFPGGWRRTSLPTSRNSPASGEAPSAIWDTTWCASWSGCPTPLRTASTSRTRCSCSPTSCSPSTTCLGGRTSSPRLRWRPGSRRRSCAPATSTGSGRSPPPSTRCARPPRPLPWSCCPNPPPTPSSRAA